MQPSIKSTAIRTIEMEARAVDHLKNFVDDAFEKAVNLIVGCGGRLVVSGIGKSAIISQKIVATMNSTGTAAIFMHAADAIHGDLGIIQPADVVMIVSKSGNSAEIRVLVPLVKQYGNRLIAMVGNSDSFLANQADVTINTFVDQEACPNNLAPTTSTTAQLVMGDALAVCLMEQKGFSREDFARFHPGGMLGKKLYLRVADLVAQNEQPKVDTGTGLKQVIVEMTRKRLGATAVTDTANNLKGIITDGDLRRMLEKNHLSDHITAESIMSTNPKTIQPDELAVNALELMRKHEISQLVVVQGEKYLGMLHIHDLLKEGFI
ncbi:MAG TPA: KpsF/GutQ family sugar-phosphate isomerase [Chitinophagaceae bacterium]